MVAEQNSALMLALFRLVGPKVWTLVAVSVPVGVVLGAVEIATASVLYAVLAEFNLVAAAPASSAMTLGLNPVVALLALAVLAAALRFGSQLLPIMSDLLLTGRLREALVRNALGGVTERSVLSVSETSHLLANVIPRGGEFVNGLATLAAAVCLLFLILAALLQLSWQLTIVALAFGGSLVLLLWLMRRAYGKYVELIHPFLRKFNMSIIRVARNNHLLRVTGVNETEAGVLIGYSRQNLHAWKIYSIVFTLSSNLAAPAAVLAVVAVLWLNDRLAFLPVSGVVPLVYLLSRTGGGVGELSSAMARLQRNWPHMIELRSHIDDLIPESDEIGVDLRKPSHILPLHASGLRFGRKDTCLGAPVSLTAQGGDVVLISGPSGQGKTTLMMTLIGLLKPIGGTVAWGGVDIERIDPACLRRRLGYAGAEPYLIDGDIRTNLRFGLESGQITDDDFEKALRLVCADFVFDLPGGLSHELREAGEGISAGQKQRLALARCLLRRPQVLLLDEATSNIDTETETQIMDNLRASFPDLLIIAVSHRASLQRYATVRVEL